MNHTILIRFQTIISITEVHFMEPIELSMTIYLSLGCTGDARHVQGSIHAC